MVTEQKNERENKTNTMHKEREIINYIQVTNYQVVSGLVRIIFGIDATISL